MIFYTGQVEVGHTGFDCDVVAVAFAWIPGLINSLTSFSRAHMVLPATWLNHRCAIVALPETAAWYLGFVSSGGSCFIFVHPHLRTNSLWPCPRTRPRSEAIHQPEEADYHCEVAQDRRLGRQQGKKLARGSFSLVCVFRKSAG